MRMYGRKNCEPILFFIFVPVQSGYVVEILVNQANRFERYNRKTFVYLFTNQLISYL